MNIVYHLTQMEEVLRTAPRHQTLSGSVIMLPEDTAQLWRNVVLEILAAAQQKREADVLPCGHSMGIVFGESSWTCVLCGQPAHRLR